MDKILAMEIRSIMTHSSDKKNQVFSLLKLINAYSHDTSAQEIIKAKIEQINKNENIKEKSKYRILKKPGLFVKNTDIRVAAKLTRKYGAYLWILSTNEQIPASDEDLDHYFLEQRKEKIKCKRSEYKSYITWKRCDGGYPEDSVELNLTKLRDLKINFAENERTSQFQICKILGIVPKKEKESQMRKIKRVVKKPASKIVPENPDINRDNLNKIEFELIIKENFKNQNEKIDILIKNVCEQKSEIENLKSKLNFIEDKLEKILKSFENQDLEEEVEEEEEEFDSDSDSEPEPDSNYKNEESATETVYRLIEEHTYIDHDMVAEARNSSRSGPFKMTLKAMCRRGEIEEYEDEDTGAKVYGLPS